MTRYAHRHNSSTKVIGVTNHFLIYLRPVPQEETCAWHHKSGHKPVVEELTGSSNESTTITSLRGHSVKLPYLCLALSSDLELHQRSFFVQLMVVNKDIHNADSK